MSANSASPGSSSREDEFYRVKKELRDLVVFAVQDALHDPPFTRVDLVSCRNLLIYLEPERAAAPAPLLPLQPDPRGILLLGSSENAAGSEEFFSPLDGHCKIFRRNDATAPQPTLRWPATHGANRDAAAGVPPVGAKTDLAEPAEQGARRALRSAGRARRRAWPDPADPWPRWRLSRAAGGASQRERRRHGAEGLRAPLASALREAIETDGRVAERSARVTVEGDRLALHLKVARLHEPAPRAAAVPGLVRAGGTQPAQTRAQERADREGHTGLDAGRSWRRSFRTRGPTCRAVSTNSRRRTRSWPPRTKKRSQPTRSSRARTRSSRPPRRRRNRSTRSFIP